MKKKLFSVFLTTGLLVNGAVAFADEEYQDYQGYEEPMINWTVLDDVPEIDDSSDANYEYIKDVAQYKLADWSQAIGRKNGISVAEAKAIADANPEIDYFFYMKGYSMVLENPNGIRVFGHGDAVFFKGTPWWGTAPGLSDGYVKIKQ